MTLIVEVEPSRPGLFEGTAVDAAETPAEALVESLTAAYLTRVDAYHRKLAPELSHVADGVPREGVEIAASAYPSMVRSADDTELLVFDAELFTTLLDIWSFEGWEAIARIEKDLARLAHVERRPDQASAGTPATPLLVAYGFFLYCRNMLAILVARGLVDLERLAATRMVTRLSVTATMVAKAWSKDFCIKRKVTKVAVTKGAPRESVTYTFGNAALMTKVTEAVGDVVAQRVAFEKLLERITHLEDALRTVNAKIARKERHGVAPPKARVDERKRLAVSLLEKRQLRDASAGWLAAMKAVVAMNCPLALLVVDGLAPGFPRMKLEEALGGALWEIYGHLDELGKGIDATRSRAAEFLAALAAVDARGVNPGGVQAMVVPDEGPEAMVADAAIRALAAEPGVLPLLHMTTWELLQQNELDTGSVEYVVAQRYLEALAVRLDRLAERDAGVAKLVKPLTRASAALSIALLVTPLAQAAPALRTVSIVGDLALAAYQISSATGQLRQLDDALGARLLEPDAFATENLARLGELMVARAGIASAMTEQLMLELLGLIAGGAWKTVRKLLVARGFVLDLQTVFTFDEETSSRG